MNYISKNAHAFHFRDGIYKARILIFTKRGIKMYIAVRQTWHLIIEMFLA